MFSVGHIRGFHYVTLTGHRSPVVACFFESKSLSVRVWEGEGEGEGVGVRVRVRVWG